MNFQSLREKTPLIVATVIGLIFALYCGSAIGSEQTRTMVLVAGAAIFLAIGLTLREAVWLIIPLTWPAGGRLLFLPLPISVREIGILIAFSWFLIFYAVKIVRTGQKYDFLDIVILIHLTFVGMLFIRNPVGTLVSGSDLIGGRPYFETAIAVLAYFVLTRARMSPLQGKLAILLNLFTTGITAVISAITFFIPSTVPVFARFYSGIEVSNYAAEMDGTAAIGTGALETSGTTRFTFLSNLGTSLFLALCSFFPPVSLANPIKIFRFIIAIIACGMIMLSGFRNLLVSAVFIFLLASIYHKKFGDLWKFCLIGAPLFAIFLGAQGQLYHLPYSIQRTLSFLPGDWDRAAVQDGKSSIEWRLYMWEAILKEDKYLKNRWWGDGFGYSRADGVAMQRALDTRQSNALQENYIIVGDVHSGPISTLRFAGYMGLILHLFFIGYIAYYANRVIRRSYGTPYFPIALFLGIPLVIHPAIFILVYGHYKTDVSNLVVSAGFIKLVYTSLLDYLARKKQHVAETEALPIENPLDFRPPLLNAGFR